MDIGVYFNYRENGPGKVVDNLLKCFDLLGMKYIINSDGDRNIILQDCNRLSGDLSNCLLGPNICTLPIDNQYVMNYNSYESFLINSEWTKRLYMRWIPEEKLKIWPAGIDTEKFSDKSNFEKKIDFLIYFKRRNIYELQQVTNFLDEKNLTYVILEYGKYTEEYFLELISNCKYGFVIDNCESQGIALQEMMSCNLSLLVWDVTNWIDRGQEYEIKATSIPYWDSICGVNFIDINQLEESFNKFVNELDLFKPRKYILDNLSIDKSTNKLLEIINNSNLVNKKIITI